MTEQRSIWSRIREYFSELAEANPIGEWFRGPPEESVSFTIAIIALSAKMAKADGRVTVDEVRTLRQIFDFNQEAEGEIAKVFDLARQDVAGYESYATRIQKLFRGRPEMLDDIFEALFILSISDDEFHENEALMLEDIRGIFGLPESFYRCLKNRYGLNGDRDPYEVLGLSHGASSEEIKSAYHKIVRDNHPDALRARNLPAETIAMAENRIRAANAAYEALGG